MIKCGKGCLPECEYFTTGGCISPFNCPYKTVENTPTTVVGSIFQSMTDKEYKKQLTQALTQLDSIIHNYSTNCEKLATVTSIGKDLDGNSIYDIITEPSYSSVQVTASNADMETDIRKCAEVLAENFTEMCLVRPCRYGYKSYSEENSNCPIKNSHKLTMTDCWEQYFLEKIKEKEQGK